jgi:hypothetical protein
MCGPGESTYSCPTDCTVCGDGICTGTETIFTCLSDCYLSVINCNGICEVTDQLFCPKDCGIIGVGGAGGFAGAAGFTTVGAGGAAVTIPSGGRGAASPVAGTPVATGGASGILTP